MRSTQKAKSIDFWWGKIVPRDSLRTKIIEYIAEYGPSSVYDISKKIYKPASKGYPSIFKNLKELQAEKILKRVSIETSEKGGKKNHFALTEYIGVPCAWAYVGPSLDFKKLLSVHQEVFKQSKGLDAYRVIWEELGGDFCVKIARKSFLGIIEGLDERETIFNLLVSYLLDGSIPDRKIYEMLKRNETIRLAIEDAIGELQKVIKVMQYLRRS